MDKKIFNQNFGWKKNVRNSFGPKTIYPKKCCSKNLIRQNCGRGRGGPGGEEEDPPQKKKEKNFFYHLILASKAFVANFGPLGPPHQFEKFLVVVLNKFYAK